MESLSLEQGREVVNEIRSDNGGVTEGDRRRADPKFLKSYDNMQILAGRAIRHVAEDLYDADTRFIFELIQNAEDNSYDFATSHHEEPYLTFALHDNRIVIDSNEDGFKKDDVSAICNIHRSSKPLTGGYIGHKGIGFKSVFKVAHEVHIQSGVFCFSFSHRRNESGMGMITPSNREHEDLPNGVRTRITLFLTQPNDFAARARELKEIPDTLLLFLRKLQRITVNLVPPLDWAPLNTSYEYRRHATGSSTTLTKAENGNENTRHFLIHTATVLALPGHPSRQGCDTAEVVLAFPVDARSNPIKEPQYVYSFLPMRREGFNFLIQSDFILQASRQSIHYCPRNYAIRSGICDLFIQAVCSFADQPCLKYEWLQYLPGAHITDPFWTVLRDDIFDRLKDSPVLSTWNGSFSYPGALQHLSSRHCDSHGQPLFDDLSPEVYLSPHYNWQKHAESLMDLGVTNHSYGKMLDRLEPYLRDDQPRFLASALDDDWHTRVANLLLRTLKMRSSSAAAGGRIKRMPLIPVGICYPTLKSPAKDVYFPSDSKGVSIPGHLPLDLVHPSSLENASRRELFHVLGVRYPDPDYIVDLILKEYNRPRQVTLEMSVSDLRYQFWSLPKGRPLDKRIYLFEQHKRPIYQAKVTYGVEIIVDDIYFETPGTCGTREISRTLQSKSRVLKRKPTEIYFIHQDYLDAVPANSRSNSQSWKEWLEEAACVRRVPQLKDRQNRGISKLFLDFAICHPLGLLDMLKEYWDSYKQDITEQIVDTIKDIEVPCKNTPKLHPMRSLFLPTAELTRICSRASIGDSFDHFVQTPHGWATNSTDEWGFLAKFGVGLYPDFDFLEDVFNFLIEKVSPNDAKDGFFAMYQELSMQFYDKDPTPMCDLFNLQAVYIPATQNRPAQTTDLKDCLWNGHPCLRHSHALATYKEYLSSPNVVYLFKNILHVSDADVWTYISELNYRKHSMEVPIDDVYAIYGEIEKGASDSILKDSIRSQFCKDELVYLQTERMWVSPAQCIWTAAPKIGGKFGISTTYAQLEGVFRYTLGVETPTVTTYVKQLQILATEQSRNLSAIKAAINSLSTLCSIPGDLDDLKETKFLPIKEADGSSKLARMTDAFFIADRTEYEIAFRGKIGMLDFNWNEIRKIHRLIKLLSLEGRYISIAVRETTVVELPDPEPSPTLTHEFRTRAKYFHRCAAHYDAARLQGDASEVRGNMRRATVYESDGFKKTLTLRQNMTLVTTESDRGLVHIDDGSNTLRIYIPRDTLSRLKCYSTDLPKALVRWLKIEDEAATATFRVVCCMQDDVIEYTLDNDGITTAADRDTGESDSSTAENEPGFWDEHIETVDLRSSNEEGSAMHEGNFDRDMTTTLFTTPYSNGPESRRPEHAFRQIPFKGAPSFSQAPGTPSVSLPDDPQYVRLLEQVITIARRGVFPQASLAETNRVSSDSIHGLASGIRSDSQLMHDRKIGAAGELYVFELLFKQSLPGFDCGNWRSNIRKKVKVHPEYQNLELWNGIETADLVYPDKESALTRILSDFGYLERTRWRNARPTYFIEVKTTTGACESPFYMSKRQYRRMQSMKLELLEDGEQSAAQVYMIFRVYSLGGDNLRAKIYLDPETLRQGGMLRFTPESYSVTPGSDTEREDASELGGAHY